MASVARGGEHALVDAAGAIYFRGLRSIRKRAADGRVEVLEGGDAQVSLDGRDAEAGFGNITALARGADESIYVLDGALLRRVDLDGQVSTLARDLLTIPADDPFFPTGEFNSIWDFVVDETGAVYLAYHGNRRLLKIGADGQVRELYHAQAPWSPLGVAVADGVVYILEVWWREDVGWQKGPRVRVMDSDGQVRTLVEVGADGELTSVLNIVPWGEVKRR